MLTILTSQTYCNVENFYIGIRGEMNSCHFWLFFNTGKVETQLLYTDQILQLWHFYMGVFCDVNCHLLICHSFLTKRLLEVNIILKWILCFWLWLLNFQMWWTDLVHMYLVSNQTWKFLTHIFLWIHISDAISYQHNNNYMEEEE